MRLHTFTITPNNRKVEAFVLHFDLPVEVHHVSFKDQETHTPGFLAMNPMGKVPALEDGDFHLWESNAILTYLAARFPETRALPGDARGRADVDRWLHWQSCHLTPALAGMKTAKGDDVTAIPTALGILEGQLATGPFLRGELSVADFALGAYFLTKSARQMDLSGHPRVAAWVSRIANLKGFVATHPKAPPGAA